MATQAMKMSPTESGAPATSDRPAQKVAAIGARASYSFVTNIRFVSMVGIVAIHSEVLSVTWEGGYYNLALDQLLKFATVCFFLISGFLLGDKLEDSSPVAYMTRRVRTTAFPWAVWSGVYFVMSLALDRLARGDAMRPVSYHLSNTVFTSAYWFVPNILISLSTLLLFRRWLNTVGLGLVLGASTVAYSLNLYFLWWSDTRHNTAWFGFILFLWLGYQLRRNFDAARAFVQRVPWWLLGTLAALTYAVAVAESWNLAAMRGPEFDHMSTLRPTNLVYSLVVFALLFKITRSIEPPGMNARQYTFGIYLLHTIVFGLVARAFKVLGARVVGVAPLEFNEHIMDYIQSPAARLGVQVGVFLVVYCSAWAAVVAMSRTPLSRIIGVRE